MDYHSSCHIAAGGRTFKQCSDVMRTSSRRYNECTLLTSGRFQKNSYQRGQRKKYSRLNHNFNQCIVEVRSRMRTECENLFDYQRKGRYCICKLWAIMHTVHKYSLDILQACVHQGQTEEEDHQASERPASGPQMAFEKRKTHMLLGYNLLKCASEVCKIELSNTVAKNIFKCVTKWRDVLATLSAK